MAEQGKQEGSCSYTKVIDNELSKIVGQDALKLQLAKLVKGILLDKRRRALGLDLGPRKSPLLAFSGNPGTGKSMVARILGKLLKMLGIFSRDKVTEVLPEDLEQKWVGGKWRRSTLVDYNNGGILLVNYLGEQKLSYNAHDENDQIKGIISSMDILFDMVILVGCPEKTLETISEWHEGIRSRVTKFSFDDYSRDQLAKILHFKVCTDDENSPFYGFKLHPSCTIDVVAKLIGPRQRKNGHVVDEILVKAKENLDSRIDVGSSDADSWVTFTSDDFAAALQLLN